MADGMLEKYLKNEPLTEEIAALREGAEPAASMEPAPQSSELTEDEREHLRRIEPFDHQPEFAGGVGSARAPLLEVTLTAGRLVLQIVWEFFQLTAH